MSKIVLISGATGGIGESLSYTFAKDGYLVAIGYNSNKDKAVDIVNNINRDGGNAIAVKFNYSSRDSIKNAIHKIESQFGHKISILINNGAIAQEKAFDTITDDDWEYMLKINLQGPFIAIQEVIDGMKLLNWGRIINISSIGGQWGGYNQVHYAAAKAGLINLTKSIAKIYSHHGITAHCISIGLVETNMSKNELSTVQGKQKVNGIPLGRLGTAEEISKIALFLASDDSQYLTGQTINANGGMYLC
ncbi:MAG: SDR family NAD(P)-dependent oxidoreductase [Turicibacter sp.]